jgi:hypothetical protein
MIVKITALLYINWDCSLKIKNLVQRRVYVFAETSNYERSLTTSRFRNALVWS